MFIYVVVLSLLLTLPTRKVIVKDSVVAFENQPENYQNKTIMTESFLSKLLFIGNFSKSSKADLQILAPRA